MSLVSEMQDHVDAGFSGIWVVTDEVYDAQNEIIKQANKSRMLCVSWTLDEGVQARDAWTTKWLESEDNKKKFPECSKPDDMLEVLPGLAVQLQKEQREQPFLGHPVDQSPLRPRGQRLILLLPNFHMRPFAESPKLTQQLARLPLIGKMEGIQFVIVILSHTTKIQPEYEKLFVLLKHSLPDEAELTKIALSLDRTVKDETVRPAVHASRGMTRLEAENAFALTLFQGKPFDPQIVWDLKAQMCEKSGLMSIYRGDDSAKQMGGLDHLFAYSKALISGYTGENPLLMPRGLLLYGVPGAGKSQFAKCLSNELKRALIMSDFGRLMGGLVGETEGNMRRFLAVVDAMAPCTLFIDEIEKALGGSGGDGRNDGGVGKRMLGMLLTWLNDHTSDVFFIGTCNDMRNMPSALTRAERFDAKFFFDFPNAKSRAAIWDIYLKMFDLPIPPVGQNEMTNLIQASAAWTGAEIRSCCRLAAIQQRPVKEVAKTIVPVSKMYAGEMSDLRKWAAGNCLAVDRDAVYSIPQEETYQSMAAAVVANGDGKSRSRVVKKSPRLKLSPRR